jgi:two-component system response regulator YesN
MRKLLIVDDNAILIEGICRNIDYSRLNVEICATLTSGAQVLEILSTNDVDLIISDIRMPGMTGLEMAREVVKIKPGIKIILISAYDDFNYAKEAIRVGAFDYVEKPLDYSYLSNVIAKAVDKINQEEQLLAELNDYRLALEQKFFYDLINYNPEEAKYYLLSNAEYLKICISYHQYLCAIVKIHAAIEVQKLYGVEYYHVLVMNLIEEIKSNFAFCPMCYCLTITDKIIIVLGCNSENGESLNHRITDLFTDFCNSHQNSNLAFSVGIGDIVSSIWQIPISHINAKAALEYRFFFADRDVLNIQDIKDHAHTNHLNVLFTDDSEEKLIRLLCQKDENGIKDFVESLSQELSVSVLDKSGVFAFIYALLAKLMKFFNDTGIIVPKIQDEFASAFSDLSKFQTSTELYHWLLKICLLACDSLQESVETHHNKICESVLKYIEQNYMNPDLCLNDISSYVNMSPHHLSAIFKKTKKQNLTDTIALIRIAKAQILLKTTNCPLKEISEKVGYANQYYFSACFKKKTGINPSAYRLNEQQ